MACLDPREANQDIIEIRPSGTLTTLPLPSNPSKSVQTLPEAPTREELHRDLLAQSERIIFLETSLYAVEAEKMTLQGVINNGRIAYGQIYNAHEQLKTHGVRVCAEYEQKITELQSEVDELRKGKFVESRVKPYKDLGESARTKFKRKFRDAFVSEINEAVKKRGLEVVHVEMRDKNDSEDKIRVNAQKWRTFNELTPLEKQRVEDISDLKSIRRISNSAYAALRSFAMDLVPLTHLKSHDFLLASFLPSFQKAPGRNGAFCSILEEISIQVAHLGKMGHLKQGELLAVKAGIDATRLTTKMCVCVYTIAVISDSSSLIGAVGACAGGDAYEDLMLSGLPFFKELKSVAQKPQVECQGSFYNFTVLMGGDMANILEIFGLSKASSRNPCEFCVVKKSLFHLAAQESFEAADAFNNTCNSSSLARTRANIHNSAAESTNNFGVKRTPICPLPLDPTMFLISVVLICMLHMRMRLTGKPKPQHQHQHQV